MNGSREDAKNTKEEDGAKPLIFSPFAPSRENSAFPNSTASRETADAKNTNERRVLNVEEISSVVVDTAFHLHRDLGPGLLESVYEVILAKQLERRGLSVERQKDVAITYDGMNFDLGFRADLLIEGKVLVELKSIEKLAPVHGKQVLTYLRLLNLPIGLLINFGSETYKEGVKRIVHQHHDFDSSRLRVRK